VVDRRDQLEVPQTPAWERLRGKLLALERHSGDAGVVRVLHLGDSEIAGDDVASTIRRAFVKRYGDAGPGFAFAAAPWDWYRREHFTHTLPDGFNMRSVAYPLKGSPSFGPGGIAFDATAEGATARVGVKGPDDACTVRFVYQTSPRGGALDLLMDGKAEQRVVTDAPALGVERFEKDFDACPHELAVSAASLPVRVFGWSVERRHPGVVWSTLGVVSASAIHFLKEPSGLIGKSLQTLSPDLLVVAFGLNVSNVPTPPSPEEARGLERILAEYQAANPDGACLVMSPYPIAYAADDQVLASPSTALLVAQQRRVARARGCAFLDRLDLEGGAEKALEWLTSQPKLLSADNVHLTHSGAEKVGGDVARLLLRQLADGHGG
jgi:hypothetical protein